MSRIVVLDTSIIIESINRKVDLIREITDTLGKATILVPSCVINELKRLSESSGWTRKTAARIGALLVEKHGLIVDVDCKKGADHAVLRLAILKNGIVATCDSELRKRAKERGLKVAFLRLAKGRIEIE